MPVKNKLSDLNDYLFEQLERLNVTDLSSEDVDKETKRAKAMVIISSQVLKSNKLVLDAFKMLKAGDLRIGELPAGFGIEQKNLDK